MKLEIGKRYVRRDGKATGGLFERDISTNYPFYDEVYDETYTEEGKWHIFGET